MSLLEMRLENQENQAATKAQIVKALKAMQNSLKYGEEVREVLVHTCTHKHGLSMRHRNMLLTRMNV